MTGQGAYQGIIRWREPTNSELFQGGRAQDDPEEIFDHIDGKPTVERAPLEGRSRDAGSTDAKEKDVTMSSTDRKICLVGTPFTIPFVKCTCELPPRLFPPEKTSPDLQKSKHGSSFLH